MSIKYDSKTRTYYVEYRPYDINGKKKKSATKKRGFLTKKDAKQFELSVINKKSVSKDYIFRDIAEEYISGLNSNERSKNLFRAYLRRHFKYNDYSINQIDKPSLSAWNKAIRDSIAPRTANQIISLVKSVYKYANNIYDIPDISFVLHRFKVDSVNNDMSVWTIEEFNKFIAVEDNPIYNAFFSCLFWTGARRGEVIALQKSDYDSVKKTLKISKAMKHYNEGFTKPKTLNSNRTIELDNKLNNQLKELLKIDGDFLFGYDVPLSLTSIDRHFKENISKSHVKAIRLHDLRHSHATILINNGVNIVAVSRRLGHTDVNITLKTYTHLLQDTNKELMDKLNGLR